MLTRHLRLGGHVVAVVLLAGVAVAATGAGARAAGGASARPESYGGTATAAAIEFRVDKQPFPFPVTDPFHVWVPYAGPSFDSSGGSGAIASSIYPGQGIIGLPALLCEFDARLCEQVVQRLPDYPDWAHAQYPSHQDDSARLSQKPFPGTGPFEITPNRVDAHADPDRAESTTITGAAGLATAVTVQSANAHSLQRFQGSTLVLSAESVLKGIDIGGQVHIDEIRSTATAQIDGSHVGSAFALTTISGATVAGNGVTIDSTGIHAAGESDKGQVKQQINAALKALESEGISVKSLGTSKAAHASQVNASTGGLLVVITRPVDVPNPAQLPVQPSGTYLLTATLGGAGIDAFASPAVPLGGSIQVPPPPPVTGGGPAPAAAGGAGAPPPDASATQTQPASTGQPPAVAAGPAPKPAALASDLTNKRLKTLALVLLGYPLLVLLAAPFRAPARLPRIS